MILTKKSKRKVAILIDIHTRYISFANKIITRRVQALSIQHRIEFNTVIILDNFSQWGSCSKKKNLTFNWRLIRTPTFVMDYIILHELIHCIIMNHKNEFWSYLSLLCPDYEQAQDWLKNHERYLRYNYTRHFII